MIVSISSLDSKYPAHAPQRDYGDRTPIPRGTMWLYILMEEEQLDTSGPVYVKLGVTAYHPSNRISVLQAGNPRRLITYFAWIFPERHAWMIESAWKLDFTRRGYSTLPSKSKETRGGKYE